MAGLPFGRFMDAAVAEIRCAQQRRLRGLPAQKFSAQRARKYVSCAMHSHIDGFLLYECDPSVQTRQVADAAAGSNAGNDCIFDLLRI